MTVRGPEGPVTDTRRAARGPPGMPELGGSYFTFATENNYTIWTFIKKVWERAGSTKGHDVMPWCPRCETGISQHEIVTDGYRELTHAAPVVFPLRRALPPHGREGKGGVAGLDDDAVDAHQQRRCGGGAGADLREGQSAGRLDLLSGRGHAAATSSRGSTRSLDGSRARR
jgi:hypothetical protein